MATFIGCLTDTSIADFAKPGETFDQAMVRKKSLNDLKAILK